MNQDNANLPPEVQRLNKILIGAITIAIAAFGLFALFSLGDENSSLIGDTFLLFFIKDQGAKQSFLEYFSGILQAVTIGGFAFILYLLNKKEALKKKYNIKDGDQTDIDIGNFFKGKNNDDKQ
ncbi:MAG: hypothetical protein NTZ49_00910 [Candidatus Parcubacteria bacterium]|nr:hypothetical protein [Candidatus Parcubacteria bacterium]